ncbi:insecticyanin-A-like [Vanessa atalanta]|uniref:insecticyanin-A-like n=1 Tax=Vanessa atalanta TaxID=42275 RepID=UPI001FCE09F5|nr:insecticyanin-A-like [Vanessa atalanta]
MLRFCIVFILCNYQIECVMQNISCPNVSPRELDLVELDGKWYLTAVATDLNMQGDCAMVVFNHKNNNATDVSISWVVNNTATYYNGSVALTVGSNGGDLLLVTYTDQKSESYSVLDVNYEHYALIFACYDNPDGNSSTYELWKLTRTPHLKKTDAAMLDQIVGNYSLQNTPFLIFNNTEDSCKLNSGNHLNPAALVMTSAAAITLLRRLY